VLQVGANLTQVDAYAQVYLTRLARFWLGMTQFDGNARKISARGGRAKRRRLGTALAVRSAEFAAALRSGQKRVSGQCLSELT